MAHLNTYFGVESIREPGSMEMAGQELGRLPGVLSVGVSAGGLSVAYDTDLICCDRLRQKVQSLGCGLREP